MASKTTSNADGLTHTGSFTLILAPTDLHSGVASTWYSVDGKTYKSGTTVVVAGPRDKTVRFYSIDNAGNVEGTRSASIRID